MHICHINLSREFSGGEIQTLNLLEGLSKNSVQQSIVLRHDSQMIKMLRKLDISYIPANFFWSNHKSLDNSSVDVFHAHDAKSVHWAYWYTRFTKHSYVLTIRVDNKTYNRFITKRAYKQANKKQWKMQENLCALLILKLLQKNISIYINPYFRKYLMNLFI